MALRVACGWGMVAGAWLVLAVAACAAEPAVAGAGGGPAMTLMISPLPTATGAVARAVVAGGTPPYRYRWSMNWHDQPQVGGDAPELAEFAIQPWLRALVCCEVTDAQGQTARAFRHILPLPPGERTGPVRFFGIGDSMENSGGAWDAEHPAVIAVAAHLCEQAMGYAAGEIPWARCSYPGYASDEIAANLPKVIEQVRAFGATDVFIRMGLNDSAPGRTPTNIADTIIQVARDVKAGCPSVERVWMEPCTGRAESDDRLWRVAQRCRAAEKDWLHFTCEAGHWHQRRAPNLYPDETHAGPEANRALGLARAAAWIVKGPPSHPAGAREP